MTPRRALAVLAIAALAVLTACSDPARESVADQVDAQIARALEVDRSDIATTCPDSAEATEGAAFDCEVRVEEQPLSTTVTFTSDTEFTYVINGEVFDKAELVAALKRDAAGIQGAEVTQLECPGDTKTVIRRDETITCTGTDANGDGGKAIVGLDADGKAVIQKLTN
jgi:hypothetical protein